MLDWMTFALFITATAVLLLNYKMKDLFYYVTSTIISTALLVFMIKTSILLSSVVFLLMLFTFFTVKMKKY